MAAGTKAYSFHSPQFGDRSSLAFGMGYSGLTTHQPAGPSCGNVCRWTLHRCWWITKCVIHTRLFILTAMILAVIFVSLSASRTVEPEFTALISGRDDTGYMPTVKGIHVQNSSKILTTPAKKTRPKPTTKSAPPPSNVTKVSNTTLAVSYFADTYNQSYPADVKQFFTEIKKIIGRKWKANASNTQQFRKDIRAALGAAGKAQNVYLTKHNTPKRARMMFYMAGRPQNIADSIWQTLPKESVFQPGRFRSCSVVGSSGLLRKSGCGKKIDSAGFVIRFNLAPVRGFGLDVGTKTNFTTLNPTFIMYKMNSIRHKDNATRMVQALSQFRDSYLYLPGYAVSGSLKLLVKAAGVAREANVVKPIYGSPDHFLAVSELWRKTLHTGKKWPSTGLYAVSSLFDVCDQINVYGFWPYKTSLMGTNVPYHYFNEIKGTSVHNFDKEFKSLMYLHEHGIINLHLRTC